MAPAAIESLTDVLNSGIAHFEEASLFKSMPRHPLSGPDVQHIYFTLLHIVYSPTDKPGVTSSQQLTRAGCGSCCVDACSLAPLACRSAGEKKRRSTSGKTCSVGGRRTKTAQRNVGSGAVANFRPRNRSEKPISDKERNVLQLESAAVSTWWRYEWSLGQKRSDSITTIETRTDVAGELGNQFTGANANQCSAQSRGKLGL